jgi:hypothetical protein
MVARVASVQLDGGLRVGDGQGRLWVRLRMGLNGTDGTYVQALSIQAGVQRASPDDLSRTNIERSPCYRISDTRYDNFSRRQDLLLRRL